MESPLQNGQDDKLEVQQNGVSRQDSGMPPDEDLFSPTSDSPLDLSGKRRSLVEAEDADGTLNSECNITVIHVTSGDGDSTIADASIIKDDDEAAPGIEGDKKEYAAEGKDSKDGSDSGVEGCAVEPPRVQSRNSMDYASSCNGLDEASCDSSLVSCCSVYEDPCATLPDDLRPSSNGAGTNGAGGGGGGGGGGGEGTSEGGSESSSIAGSVSATRVQKRTAGATAQPKRKVNTHGSTDSQKSGGVQRPNGRPATGSNGATTATTTTAAAAAAAAAAVAAASVRGKPRATPQRAASLSKAQSTSRDRGRPREKSLVKETSCRDGSTTTPRGPSTSRCAAGVTASTAASRSRARPDSLPSALTTEINKDLAQRGRGAGATRVRGGSTSRQSSVSTRTPGSTPSEDGRKSLSTVGRSSSVFTPRIDLKSTRFHDKMTASMDGSIGVSKALDTYGTLPRTGRHKFTVPRPPSERPPVANRSRSGSRDTSLNRLLGRKALSGKEMAAGKGLPPYPKQKAVEKTRIYHEISVQTGLTSKDIDNCLAGVATILPHPDSAEKSEGESQTEGSWEELQDVKGELKKVSGENEERRKENEKLRAEVEGLRKSLEEEKADHAFARKELDRNAQRVLAMLGTPTSEHAGGSDSFLELETHIQSSGQVVANQQIEIADLQSLCRMLSRDLEKSLAAQKALLQQQQEMEAESIEMQDFLQEEKTTLEIALKESETELKRKDESIKQLSSELERQTGECKHLVRISEQRRQENLSMSMRLNAVERRSKELLLAQGAAVSGASVALSGLGNRLEGLVDQLIMSYNISEKDLEDVIYHNEAFSRSNSSVESSPVSSKHSTKDCTPSPKRGSFVSAVIGAIRNAATHPFAIKTNEKKPSDTSKVIPKDLNTESSSDLLDFETEPCLMMESVLEDVPLPDTYSHNMVSSCDSLRRVLSVPETPDDHSLKASKMNGESTSLTNLTQAILNRRRVEDEEEENCESISESETGPSEGPLPLTDYCPVTSLVDQVIDVDNLVTKLLKVLRIIQLDNDTCIQELKDEKSELETRLEIFLAERKTALTVESSQEFENNISSNGVDHQSLIENCKHVIKEINDVKELIVDGQMERNKCISEESKEEDQNANAAVLLSSSVCS